MQTNTGSAPTFALYNPKAWKAFSEAFTGYVKHISSLEKDTPNAAEPTLPNNTYSAENMTYAPSGLPLLSTAVKNEFGTETKKMQQTILRVYLSKHYSMVFSHFGSFGTLIISSAGYWQTRSQSSMEAHDRRRRCLHAFHFPARSSVVQRSSYYRGEDTHDILSLWRATSK